jgi:hypothetical protein
MRTKIMVLLFWSGLLTPGSPVATAQGYTRVVSLREAPADSIDPADPAFRARYASIPFKDHFSLKVASDKSNNYYIVDFGSLASRFQKVWFLNQVFSQHRVINIDSDITQDRVWFMASNQYPEKDVQELFLNLKKRTEEQSASMTKEEQEAWLKKNDKYQDNK